MKSFGKPLDLNDPERSLPAFPSETNQKLDIISNGSKMVIMFMSAFDSCKVPTRDCITIVLMK